jgi:elongation factor 1-beta
MSSFENEIPPPVEDVKKTKYVAKSLVVLEVKPWDVEVNLDELAAKILQIEKDGLTWKTEYQIVPIGYGISKIRIGCVVEDELVSVDDLVEEIQGFEEEVQAVDIYSFNKL